MTPHRTARTRSVHGAVVVLLVLMVIAGVQAGLVAGAVAAPAPPCRDAQTLEATTGAWVAAAGTAAVRSDVRVQRLERRLRVAGTRARRARATRELRVGRDVLRAARVAVAARERDRAAARALTALCRAAEPRADADRVEAVVADALVAVAASDLLERVPATTVVAALAPLRVADVLGPDALVRLVNALLDLAPATSRAAPRQPLGLEAIADRFGLGVLLQHPGLDADLHEVGGPGGFVGGLLDDLFGGLRGAGSSHP